MENLKFQRVFATVFFIVAIFCAARLAVHVLYVRLWVLLAAAGITNGVLLWMALRKDDPQRTRDAMWASAVIFAIGITPFAHLL